MFDNLTPLCSRGARCAPAFCQSYFPKEFRDLAQYNGVVFLMEVTIAITSGARTCLQSGNGEGDVLGRIEGAP
jgi:hypothetical protein